MEKSSSQYFKSGSNQYSSAYNSTVSDDGRWAATKNAQDQVAMGKVIQLHVSYISHDMSCIIDRDHISAAILAIAPTAYNLIIRQQRFNQRTGIQSGYGFVSFPTLDEALAAKRALKGTTVQSVLFDCALANRSAERLGQRPAAADHQQSHTQTSHLYHHTADYSALTNVNSNAASRNGHETEDGVVEDVDKEKDNAAAAASACSSSPSRASAQSEAQAEENSVSVSALSRSVQEVASRNKTHPSPAPVMTVRSSPAAPLLHLFTPDVLTAEQESQQMYSSRGNNLVWNPVMIPYRSDNNSAMDGSISAYHSDKLSSVSAMPYNAYNTGIYYSNISTSNVCYSPSPPMMYPHYTNTLISYSSSQVHPSIYPSLHSVPYPNSSVTAASTPVVQPVSIIYPHHTTPTSTLRGTPSANLYSNPLLTAYPSPYSPVPVMTIPPTVSIIGAMPMQPTTVARPVQNPSAAPPFQPGYNTFPPFLPPAHSPPGNHANSTKK